MNIEIIVPRTEHKTVIWMNRAVIIPRPKKGSKLDEHGSNYT
jgi:hypothetical protein